MKLRTALFISFGTAIVVSVPLIARSHRGQQTAMNQTSTGHFITPAGTSEAVGSFPCNSLLTPDNRFLIVTDAGFRESLSVIDTASGKVVDSKNFDKGIRGAKDSLYYGLALAGDGSFYVSEGTRHLILHYSVDDSGKLQEIGDPIKVPTLTDSPVAGIAFDSAKNQIGAVVCTVKNPTDHSGEGYILDAKTGSVISRVDLPGMPLGLACVNGEYFTTSEVAGGVVPFSENGVEPLIKTGLNPSYIAVQGQKLIVCNSDSDTVSTIDPVTKTVVGSFSTRPQLLRGYPSTSPLSVSEDGNGHTFVALGDYNAVGVWGTKNHRFMGYIPAGWYPTSVKVVGSQLFVCNAKGVQAVNPNNVNAGPKGAWGKYSPNIIEGTVNRVDLTSALADLKETTDLVLTNNRIQELSDHLKNPGIQHVIYIIKENRTYDQVFGDMPEGNGDASICLFPESVTPNQHALARRFGLFDNFYDVAECSGDGWNWSTQGMANEYVARNLVNNYSGRWPNYDFEGTTANIALDRFKLHNPASTGAGYLWDDALKHGRSIRNYGFYVDEGATVDDKKEMASKLERINQRSLLNHTDVSFREFDTRYADSDILTDYQFVPPKSLPTYGVHHSTSRFTEWKREFDGYLKSGKLPSLMMIRMMKDHTSGTSAGYSTPQAMVADNDYAVGQIVDLVSHSKFWNTTAICILEDDSQAGYDHVDCHRSTALVISPYSDRSKIDHHFYNTDSMLKTIEDMLGIPPMTGFDATAAPINILASTAVNAEPYEAIKPAREIACAVNEKTAYKAQQSAKMLHWWDEEEDSDLALNEILWHSIRGNIPPPKIVGSTLSQRRGE